MSGNFYDREGNAVDPYSPFEEILILSPRKCFDNETMVDTQILFAQHSEPIVRRGDRAIAMLLSDRSRDSALHQPVQNQVTYYLAHRAARLISDATDLLPPDTRR